MTPHRRNHILGAIVLPLAILFLCLPASGSRVNSVTANSADELTEREKELIQEINLLRTDPSKYAQFLEQSKKYFKGKDYKPPGQTQSLTTIEGVAAVDEAIKVLRMTKPLAPYSMSPGMCRAAKDHAKDLGSSGNTGHKGSDGSTVESRVNRYGRFSNGIGENIIYESSTVRDAVMGWLVDDGVSNRGHRRNLLSSTYRYLGAAVGERSDYGSMCVLTFAGEYVDLKVTPSTDKSKAVRKM